MKISIIGSGFSGMMTAIQCIEQCTGSLEIIIFEESGNFSGGIAYNPYSERHILNVVCSKMSAFPDKPNHFLDWIMQKDSFRDKDITIVANAFLPRTWYGEYLQDIWNNSLQKAKDKKLTISLYQDRVTDLSPNEQDVQIICASGNTYHADYCVLATGNLLPGDPKIKNPDFYKSHFYYKNPWQKESVLDLDTKLPVLIIGNGLTMVDTILGLLEAGFKGEMISISPNGFNILPHRHNGLSYHKLKEELALPIALRDLVQLVHRHIKTVREFGVSAEPVIDSLRPFTQTLWQGFSSEEKQLFMRRLRHLWGVARHRIPVHTHDKIQQLRIEGRLQIYSGKIIDMQAIENFAQVEFYDKTRKEIRKVDVQRIINCSGPETHLDKIPNHFLSRMKQKGWIKQDELNLGIEVNTENFRTIHATNMENKRIYALGLLLKGKLWESTAVNEIRAQAQSLTRILLNQS